MISQVEIDRAFAIIEAAAVKGERAPQNAPFGPLRSLAVHALYKAGRVRGEVFGGNWRRLTILDGPHHGKATMAPPYGTGEPYRVIPAMSRMVPRRIAP